MVHSCFTLCLRAREYIKRISQNPWYNLWMRVKGPHTQDWEPWPIHFKHSYWWKGGAGPSSLHTTLEGPTDYVRAKWMKSLHGFLHGIERIMFHGHLNYYQKPPRGARPNTKPGDHGTPNAHNRWFIPFYHVWTPYMNRNSLKWQLVEGPVTYDFTLHLRPCDHTPWFWRCVGTAFGHFLISSHNFMGSWPVWEVALNRVR